MGTGDPVIDEVIEALRKGIRNFMISEYPSLLNGVEKTFIEVTDSGDDLPNFHVFHDGIYRGTACDVCPKRLKCITREVRLCETIGNYLIKYDITQEIKRKQNLQVDDDALVKIIEALGFVEVPPYWHYITSKYWQKGSYVIAFK